MFPYMLLFLRRVPEHAIEENSTVLNLNCCISGISVHPAAVSTFDMELIFLFMLDSWSSIFKGFQSNGETSKIISFTEKFSPIPSVEVSKDSHSPSSRTPLHECDVVVWLNLKTKLFIRSCEIQDSSFSSLENVQPSIIYYKNEIKITYFLYSFCLK